MYFLWYHTMKHFNFLLDDIKKQRDFKKQKTQHQKRRTLTIFSEKPCCNF